MTPDTGAAVARLFSRNVDWNLFLVFHEIARCGSISGAARALNRQQPSISASLKRLEEHLETELCRRGSHGIELTATGRALHVHCEQLLAHVRAVPQDVAQAACRVEGVIAVRTISDLVSPELNAAITRFHSRHPNVELKLEVAPWQAVVRGLLADEVELGIACDDALNPELRYEPLMRETQQAYCSSCHPLFGQPPVHPAQLVNQQFVLTGADEPSELSVFRRRFGLGQRVGGFAETLHEVRWLIELGVGIGFLPTVIAESAVRAGHLWPLLPEELLPSYYVYVITRRNALRNSPTQMLLDTILEETRTGVVASTAA